MKFVLIPLKDGSASDEPNVLVPAIIMHLISAIALSIMATSKWLPDLHGWGRFGLCVLAVVVFMVLSMLPIVGVVIGVANAILWIVILWMLFGGIDTAWLKWVLRIVVMILIVLFEGVSIMSLIRR